jgi:hypothetical protein
MTESTKNANHCCVLQVSLAAHNRTHGHDMIGIGRVAHAKEKSQKNHGEKSDHGPGAIPEIPFQALVRLFLAAVDTYLDDGT